VVKELERGTGWNEGERKEGREGGREGGGKEDKGGKLSMMAHACNPSSGDGD
jgi:hypothetical protein